MLKPAILALIRQVLTVAGTALVAKAYVQASEFKPVIGPLLPSGRSFGRCQTSAGGERYI